MTTAQLITARTKNEISRYYGQKGYWKQRIAMNLSRVVGSLKLAWKIINFSIKQSKELSKAQESFNWVEKITEGLEKRLGKSVKTTF